MCECVCERIERKRERTGDRTRERTAMCMDDWYVYISESYSFVDLYTGYVFGGDGLRESVNKKKKKKTRPKHFDYFFFWLLNIVDL